MKTLKKILIAGMIALSSLSCGEDDGVKNIDKVFYGSTAKDYIQQIYLADINKDGTPDYIFVQYDFNKNGKSDALAGFKIKRFTERGTVITNDYAKFLAVDKDEDGRFDYIYMDTDGNETLDKEFKSGNKKFPKDYTIDQRMMSS